MDSLKLITGIRYSRDMMNAVNHMTYFFDPNWRNDGETTTFPVVFFYAFSLRESKTNQVNKNTLIVYDDSTKDNSNNAQRSYTQIILDNSVLEPETIIMEIGIPHRISQMNYFDRALNSTPIAYGASSFIRKIIMPIIGDFIIGANDLDEGLENFILNESREQIDSLKRMMDRKLPIQMKMPYGWKFRNGIITGMDISKQSDEEAFSNATVTLLMEPPILRIKSDLDYSVPEKREPDKDNEWLGRKMISAFSELGGLS